MATVLRGGDKEMRVNLGVFLRSLFCGGALFGLSELAVAQECATEGHGPAMAVGRPPASTYQKQRRRFFFPQDSCAEGTTPFGMSSPMTSSQFGDGSKSDHTNDGSQSPNGESGAVMNDSDANDPANPNNDLNNSITDAMRQATAPSPQATPRPSAAYAAYAVDDSIGDFFGGGGATSVTFSPAFCNTAFLDATTDQLVFVDSTGAIVPLSNFQNPGGGPLVVDGNGNITGLVNNVESPAGSGITVPLAGAVFSATDTGQTGSFTDGSGVVQTGAPVTVHGSGLVCTRN